jgi:glycosyltransferase involved in cell wall biosynthesis
MAMTGTDAGRVDVSVVIPVRNGGELLLRAVKSVERVAVVSPLSIEVVVVDDGADVSLRAIVDTAHLNLPTSVVEGRAAGPSAARNAGAACARGDHLAFLDVDDVVLAAWGRLAECIVTDPARPSAVRAAAIIEDVTGGSRRVEPPSWLPACYILRRSSFEGVDGFDERVWYGEHHQLGGRLTAIDADVVDRPDLGPVMVKVDDRSIERRRAYAARRLEAAHLEREQVDDPRERARSWDTAAVSLARMSDWSGARAAARNALDEDPDNKRRVRSWVLRVPVVRGFWYRGRLTADDRLRRARQFASGRRTAIARTISIGRALFRGPPPAALTDEHPA